MALSPSSQQIKPMNIVITGINGFLGSTLRIVLGSNHAIYDIGVDITDRKAVENFKIPRGKIDWIIHTAALVDVDFCEHNLEKCYKVNVEGTKNVRDLAKKYSAKIMYISSMIVFPCEEGNYKENDIPYPKNFYAFSKVLGEQAILDYERGLVLRTNLIGVHPNGSRTINFFEWVVDLVTSGKDMKLFKDVMVNPLSNWTVAELIGRIIKLDLDEKILHLASRNPLSKAEIGKCIIGKLGNYKGRAIFVNADSVKNRVFRPKQMWLNSNYAQKKLKVKMPSIQAEIEKIFKNLERIS